MTHHSTTPALFRTAPPSNGTPTSKAAAVAIAPHVGEQSARVLAIIRERPGITREGVAAMGIRLASVCARVNGLLTDRLIVERDTAPTSSGRQAMRLWAVETKA